MKEKIKKMHDKYAAPCKFGITSSDFDLVSQEIELLVNQEVEKRIAERMPSEEEIDKWVKSHGYYGSCTQEWYEGLDEGAKWLRSRLTQKTEGETK